MQYTGSGFSWDFGRRFQGVMAAAAPAEGARRLLPDRRLPADRLCRRGGAPAVQRHQAWRRDPPADLSQRLREDDPRLSFAAVLVTLVVIGGLVVLTGGALQMSAAATGPCTCC
jgi:hydrogenase-4 component B